MTGRTLSAREQRMLFACIAVLLIAGTSLLASEFNDRRKALDTQIKSLVLEKKESEAWLNDRAFQEKRGSWLDANMPSTDSLGRAQGQLHEELQNAVLDRELKLIKATPNDSTKTANYQEVSVTVSLSGDQTVLLNWLATLQSPELFQVIKSLEIEQDTKTKAKTPQCICNLTLARWFKPEDS